MVSNCVFHVQIVEFNGNVFMTMLLVIVVSATKSCIHQNHVFITKGTQIAFNAAHISFAYTTGENVSVYNAIQE